MKVYAISGLGADERVFRNMDIGHELIHLNWIEPLVDDTLPSYAKRLSEGIQADEDFVLIGVSFGGMIAVEIEKILTPRQVILISSAQGRKDLHPIFRLIGRTGLISMLPNSAFNPDPKHVAKLFGTKKHHRSVLDEILGDSDPNFTRWAMSQISKWQNKHHSDRVVMIHGTKDRVLQCPKRNTVLKIEGGGHGMIMDRAREINQMIRTILDSNS